MGEKNLLDLWEVRRLLEPPATAKAAERISGDDLSQLQGIFDYMRHGSDVAATVTDDAHFHEIIVESAGNETLASILSNLSSRTLRSRVWRSVKEAGAVSITIAEHADILAALEAHDTEMARAAAALHVCTSEAWFRSKFARVESPVARSVGFKRPSLSSSGASGKGGPG